MKLLAIISLLFLSPTTEQSIDTKDGGKLKFYNEGCLSNNGENCDIIIEKYDTSQKLSWKAAVGGSSWDYVEDVIEVADGFLVLGNTSSYGQGNLDVYVVKLDPEGKEQWFRTYGAFFNEYGRTIAPSGDPDGGYIIKGERQHCLKENVSQDCYMKPLTIKINEIGDNLYEQ